MIIVAPQERTDRLREGPLFVSSSVTCVTYVNVGDGKQRAHVPARVGSLGAPTPCNSAPSKSSGFHPTSLSERHPEPDQLPSHLSALKPNSSGIPILRFADSGNYDNTPRPGFGRETRTSVSAPPAMPLDSLSYTAPARLRALLCPLGRIKRHRFSSFTQRLHANYVVRLGDVTPDPQRSKLHLRRGRP